MKAAKVLRGVFVTFIACVLAVCATACANHEEEAIRETVDNMMVIFQNPVENDAASNLDDDTLTTLEQYGVDVNDYLSHCFRNLSYEITDVTVNGDTATVSLDITNANLVTALDAAGADFKEWAATDEATELYRSDGEGALYGKLFEYLYARLDAEDVELTTTSVQLHLTKDSEGTWTVDPESAEFYSALYGGADFNI